MIKMLNRFTGTIMWVADDRVEKYLAAGHKLADVKAEKPTPPVKRNSEVNDYGIRNRTGRSSTRDAHAVERRTERMRDIT